jgi:hypothetical protein
MYLLFSHGGAMKVFLFPILAVLWLLPPPVLLSKEIPKIAVWDLSARNIKPEYAQELTSILVSELAKLKKFEVYSQENVRTIAGWTAERMKLGCTDTQCLLALGQMDIAKLVSGSVAKIGNRYSISLNLFDTQQAKAENAISEFCNSEDELIELIQKSGRILLGVQRESPGVEKKAVGVDKKIPLPVDVAEGKPRREINWDKCAAPIWKVGDKWVYKTQDGKIRTETVAEITKELFILDIGERDRLGYEKSTMNLEFLVDPRGEKTKYRGWQEKIFYFPLYVGKTWSYSYSHYWGDAVLPYAQISNEYKIEALEDVSTGGGMFKAYRIVLLNSAPRMMIVGRGRFVIWYSPEVQNYVKKKFDHISGPSTLIRKDLFEECEIISYSTIKGK